ncbi:MAG TPA: winged helix DNA-binding domain-containing protein [Gemmatimonadaceae bacterium]|nr:winged helix DNA-binding domain-containing protein [Gemmatimonadaceae bacterium]
MISVARTAASLTPRTIAARRLANQHLIGPRLATPLEVVRKLGAVQSQDYAGGKWGIGQRTRSSTDADVESALTAGTIVRTHVLRPTWHFVAAEDIRWMLELTGPRVRARMAPYDRHLELDEKVFARCAAAITSALDREKELTRGEIRAVLDRARIGTTGTQRLAHIMMRAELDGVVCSGVRKGKQSTYALLEDRLPPARVMNPDESLAELARRYFSTRGPATVQDFAWWSGLTASESRRGIEAVRSDFDNRVVEGKTYWFTGSAPARRLVGNAAHLLPNYDEFFIGLKDRSAMAGLVKAPVMGVWGGTSVTNVVVIEGQLVGGWSPAVTTRGAALQVRLAVKLNSTQLHAIEKQVKRYAEFSGMPAEVRISALTKKR